MPDQIKLKPCHCGGDVKFHDEDGCDGCHYIHCKKCGGLFDYADAVDPSEITDDLEDLKKSCAKLWNKRGPLIKEHEYAEFINALRDTSITYADTQQLREQLIKVVDSHLPQLKGIEK